MLFSQSSVITTRNNQYYIYKVVGISSVICAIPLLSNIFNFFVFLKRCYQEWLIVLADTYRYVYSPHYHIEELR